MEQWKAIPGYEGFYEVSDLGRIRGLDRKVRGGRWGTQTIKGGIVKSHLRDDGYPAVNLRKEGERTKLMVHRLVLLAFRGEPKKGEEARHLNDQREDARLENLEWGSRSENLYDRGRNGIDFYRNKTHCPLGHPLEEPNLIPSQAKRGNRSCLACMRSHSNVKTHPDLKGLREKIADVHFDNIVNNGGKRLTIEKILVMVESSS